MKFDEVAGLRGADTHPSSISSRSQYPLRSPSLLIYPIVPLPIMLPKPLTPLNLHVGVVANLRAVLFGKSYNLANFGQEK